MSSVLNSRGTARRIFFLLLLALFCAPLITHVYLGSYSRFIADDFCSSAVAHSQGIVRGALYWYLNWTGRYAANPLDSTFGYLGPAVTPYATGLVVSIWFIVLAIALHEIIPSGDQRDERLLLSCVIAAMVLFAVLDVIPAIGQSLYWGQGMRSVVPPLILGTAYVALIAQRSTTPTRNKRGVMWILVAALLTFVAAGFAETYFAVQTTALVIALVIGLASNVYVPLNKKNYLLLLGAGLTGSLGGGLLMFIAPGNKFRQTAFPPPPAVSELLAIALRGLGEFLQAVVFAQGRAFVWAGLILCGFVIGAGLLRPRVESPQAYRSPVWWLLWLPVVTFLLLLACWVPMAWGTSLTLVPRTFMIPAYVLVCLLTCWAYIAGRVCRNAFAHRLRTPATIWALIILVAFGVFAVNRSRQMWQLRSTLAAYARNWDNREQEIQTAKSQGLHYVVVHRLQNRAGLDEIEVDPKIMWLTKCFQDYYGIAVIPELGDLSGEPGGEAKQAALEKQFDSIPILPGSVPAELNGIYKTPRGKIGFYKSDLPADQITAYFTAELAQLGWKYIGTKKVEAFQRYSGGTQNLFCNGETAATLFITAQDEQRLGYTYSLALNWGMSSGYLWGVVDCPQ